MTTNANTNRNWELDDSIREILIQAGFMPLEYSADPEEVSLPERDAQTLSYFEGRGWLAFRIEPDAASVDYTLARWSEDGIEIMAIDANGCIEAEARFTANDAGATWAAAVLYNA